MLPNVTKCYVSAGDAASTTTLLDGDPDADADSASDDELTDRQLAALALLATGKSVQNVADELGVHRQTLWRWRAHDERFRAELHRRQREMWEESMTRLQAMVLPSIEVIDSYLNNRYDMHRFRAATTVLRMSGLAKAVPLRPDTP